MNFKALRKSGCLLLLLFFMSNLVGFGQEKDCAVKLAEAQDQFNLGQIEEVPGLLKDCIESGFTREDRIQAYKLLINSYLFDDNPALAEQYMLEFLKKYPEYKLLATDPIEFANLFNEFDNEPRSSIGFLGGLNFTNVRRIESFSPGSGVGINDGLEGSGVYKASGSGFQAGVVYNINLKKGFELGFEPMVLKNLFEEESRPFDFTHIEYSEDQFRIDLPVSLIYNFQTEMQVDPYARLGVKASYLIIGRSDTKRSYINTGTLNFEDVAGPEEEITGTRMLSNVWAFVGGGIRYKIPKAYIFIDVRYNLGLINQVNKDSRNNGLNEGLFLYYRMDDDMFLDDISVNIGVSKTIFRPKRK